MKLKMTQTIMMRTQTMITLNIGVKVIVIFKLLDCIDYDTAFTVFVSKSANFYIIIFV